MDLNLDAVHKFAEAAYERASQVLKSSESANCETIQYLAAYLMLIIESIQEGKDGPT